MAYKNIEDKRRYAREYARSKRSRLRATGGPEYERLLENNRRAYENNKSGAKETQKRYRNANLDSLAAKKALDYRANKDVYAQYKRAFFEKNKKLIQSCRRERYKIDINFRLAYNLRNRLSAAIRSGAKTGSAVDLLGCSIESLRHHLESSFKDGMSWVNRGDWHIDHIIPLSRFNLSDRHQLSRACHYTNLQPLWRAENIGKGARL